MIVKRKIKDLKHEDIFRLHKTYGDKFICDSIDINNATNFVEINAINLETNEPFYIRFYGPDNINSDIFFYDYPLRVVRKRFLNNQTINEIIEKIKVCHKVINIRKGITDDTIELNNKSILKEIIEESNKSNKNVIDPLEYYYLLLGLITNKEFTIKSDNDNMGCFTYEDMVLMVSNIILDNVKNGNILSNKTELHYSHSVKITIDNMSDKLCCMNSGKSHAGDPNVRKLITFLTRMTFKSCFSDLRLISLEWDEKKSDTLIILIET